jgi:tetratricopeptide (TPR) repeat protein
MRKFGWPGRGVAWTLAVLAIVPAAALAAGPVAAPADDHIAPLIQLLGSPDPTEREAAQTSLVEIGEPARAALKAAQSGDDPAIAQGATAVILQLPWYTPDDPPEVRRILSGYGSMSVGQRLAAVAALGKLADSGPKVILRIIVDEPSDLVRWPMVGQLELDTSAARKIAAQAVRVQEDSPALLALAGWAWVDFDTQKGAEYFLKAVEQWRLSPHNSTADERNLLFDPLYNVCMNFRHYNTGADVLRVQLRQDAKQPELLFKLLALHADYGPLKGFADDLLLAHDELDSPLLLYCRSRLSMRMMMPQEADALRRRALAAANVSADVALNTGITLAVHGWNDFAEPQLKALLAMQPAPSVLMQINGWFRLRSIHTLAGEYQQAADDEQTAQDLLATQVGIQLHVTDPHGKSVVATENTLPAILHQARLKAAQQKNDKAAIDAELDALVKLNPDSVEIAQDIVPLLTARGRDAEAAKFFDRYYTALRGQVDANPRDPWPKNNLAWYCAQCGQRLDEADELARQAVSLPPRNAACIDTLAYCEYRLGRPQEAVRLESIALSLDQRNFVEIQQLDRFRAAAAGLGTH